jgi:hypothetical protein
LVRVYSPIFRSSGLGGGHVQPVWINIIARRTVMRLKDKVAVVTGAASGIGKEIAAT